jgi:hypothetical protein
MARALLFVRSMRAWIFFSAALAAACGSTDAASTTGDDSGTRDAQAADAGDAAPPPEDARPDALDASHDDAGIGVACSGAAPTLSKDVFPILRKSCSGGEICHGGFGATPDDVFKSLVNVPAQRDSCNPGVLVLPSDPNRSYLVHKLTGVGMCPNSQTMPLGTKLPDAEIQIFVDWICQGAKND